jgi:sphingomyelin phosphodiesterase acid-like 3
MIRNASHQYRCDGLRASNSRGLQVKSVRSRRFPFWLCSLILGFSTLPSVAAAQTPPAPAPAQSVPAAPTTTELNATIPALFISDIHLDPFHDPARVGQLVSAPVSRWSSILSRPPSPNQKAAFTSLQENCHARGVDTPDPLLQSSLRAMRTQQPDAKFIIVSGDLIAHAFSCRYTTLFPHSTPADYQSFVEKTISYVVGQLHESFPGIPIYVALGNNDSACGDYRLDPGNNFFADTARIVADGLPASDRDTEIHDFSQNGSYSVTMAPPMQNTRLIVLDDDFLSAEYRSCAGKEDPAPAAAEIRWLRDRLQQARTAGQTVWVMGHIPTGIDPYSTARRMGAMCGHVNPVLFLSSSSLADLLIEYSDVIRLGIFAHTHMDEIRLLQPEHAVPNATASAVVIKMVPSISPVDGNDPSFTIARVNPATALLQDYRVVSASNHTGIATRWSVEYDFAQTFHQPEFSPATVKALIGQFTADPDVKLSISQEYIRHYFIGDRSDELKPFWPQYVCALANYTVAPYAACVCPPAK